MAMDEILLKGILGEMENLTKEECNEESVHKNADALLITTIAVLSHITNHADICKEITDKYNSLDKWYA